MRFLDSLKNKATDLIENSPLQGISVQSFFEPKHKVCTVEEIIDAIREDEARTQELVKKEVTVQKREEPKKILEQKPSPELVLEQFYNRNKDNHEYSVDIVQIFKETYHIPDTIPLLEYEKNIVLTAILRDENDVEQPKLVPFLHINAENPLDMTSGLRMDMMELAFGEEMAQKMLMEREMFDTEESFEETFDEEEFSVSENIMMSSQIVDSENDDPELNEPRYYEADNFDEDEIGSKQFWSERFESKNAGSDYIWNGEETDIVEEI